MIAEPRMRILCLDAEGGFGGSSRSLYYLVRGLPEAEYEVEVWCRRKGPILDAYRALGVPCRVERRLVSSGALVRLNLLAVLELVKQCLLGVGLLARLARKAGEVDLVHVNLESMFALLVWLRLASRAALVVHVRTLVSDTWYGRLEARIVARLADRVVFISENERERFAALGSPVDGDVVYNVVERVEARPTPDPRVRREGFRLVVLSIGKYAWVRANERIVEVAQAVRDEGIEGIRFVVAGNVAFPRLRSPEMQAALGDARDLGELVERRGLAQSFQFLGQVDNPFEVIRACDVTLQLPRVPTSWGRSVLESLSLEVPVVTTGTYDTFVRHDETGLLYPDFDPVRVARDLDALAGDPVRRREMGVRGRRVVESLCDETRQGAALAAAYRRARAAGRRAAGGSPPAGSTEGGDAR